MRTKRFLSIVLTLAMLVGMFPGMSLTASAADSTTEITPSNTSGTMTITLTIAAAKAEELLTTITATGTEQASYSTANVATVSFSNLPNNGSSYTAIWGWWGYGWSATVNAAEGYTITKCVFYDDKDRTATDSEAPFVVETTEEDKTPKVNGVPILANQSKGITKIEVYGYATPTATHSVTITAGDHMTKTADSGDAEQTGLTGAMIGVVYTANDGYYFPENYSVAAVNGISVTRDSYTQITVSGTPTSDAAITLAAPTAKTTPAAPTTAAATDCTTADNNDGKLTGVTTEMEYQKQGDTEWTAGTGSDITGLVPETYYVRVKATDTTNASDNQELTVKGFISYTVTFKVVNGKWNEGEGDAATTDKAVTLTGHDGDTLKLTADQIPAVGSKPNDTYKAGSWDVTPSTDTAITEATTYTYTYAAKDSISQTVTFKVVNGKWDDDTTADKTVTLTGYEGDTLKLATNQIPAVGTKPNDTYKAGSWDVTPSAETEITAATTYTYTYAQKDSISQTVTFKVVNGSWDDDSTEAKTVTLTGYEGDVLKLAANQIPAVGSKPSDTYKAGSWDVTPSTDTVITAATTYTYTYVAKEASVVTKAPEAKTLTYNGQAQALVTAGEASGGTMYYAVTTENTAPTDESLYTTSIPSKTNAGTYYVWYKVVGDSNHNDTSPDCVTVTVNKAAYDVTITPGSNMTKTTDSGAASQTSLSGAMTAVVYTADSSCYFPTNYSVAAVNGISVTRNSYTQITVSGTPTANATITLTAPTAKTTPDTPMTADAVNCTSTDNNDGKLTGVTSAMEYRKSDADSWTNGTGSDITGLVPGTYYVRVKATDTTLASDSHTLTIRAFISASVTFKVSNGSWDDESATDKTVILSGYEGVPLTLAAADIPVVGGKPAATYKEGNWDTTPDTATEITGNTTYTYTYAKKTAISVTVTFKVINGSWDDESTADKTVTLTGYEGDTLKLLAEDIPAVGDQPEAAYKKGSWNTIPDTDTEIPEDTTYIYSYAAKTAALIMTAPTARNLMYTGSDQELVSAGTAENGTMQYALGNDSQTIPDDFNTSIPTGNASRTYYVWYKAAGDGDHLDSAAACVAVTIYPADTGNTEPSADVLTYTGEPQELVLPGTASGGTFRYALGENAENAPEEGWTEAVPAGTEAGDYYVWYQILGDSNHNDVSPACIQVTIAKAGISPTVSLTGWTYGQKANTPAVEGNPGNGVVTYTYSKEAEGTYRSETPTEAGTWFVKASVAETANYGSSETKPLSFAIAKASITIKAADQNSRYGTELKNLTYKVSGDYVEGDDLGVVLTTAAAASADAGSYPITVESWNKNPNYEATFVPAAYTITKAQITIRAANKSSKRGNKLVNLTYKVMGDYIDGDALGVSLSTKASKTAKPGSYEILISWNNNPNYTAALEKGTYTIKDQVTADEKAKAKLMLDGSYKVRWYGRDIAVEWGHVAGADRYEVWAAYCGTKPYQKVGTVNGSTFICRFRDLNGSRLNLSRNVKVYVKAYRKVNGKETLLAKSLTTHIPGNKNKRYTFVKKVVLSKNNFTLKVKQTARISGRAVLADENKQQLPDGHEVQFRYASSDPKVARVSSDGKITAVGKGSCTIYVYSRNGYPQKVKVVVK